jgi:hypothetical protein
MQDLIARSSAGGLSWWLYLQLWSLPVAATAGLLFTSIASARRARGLRSVGGA